MLTLDYPWLLAAAVLPPLLRRVLPAFRQARGGVAVPFLDRVAALTGQTPGREAAVSRPSRTQRVASWLVWLCIVAALARPQWLEPAVTRTLPTRDLLLAVDLSGSMETRDFTDPSGTQVDRLTAVKQVLDDFLARRKGDRVALVFFGSAAFVQAPFTEDLDALRALLAEAQVGMAGPKTALGDAIGLALTIFERDQQARDRVVIALTDGNDTSSQVPPARAAEIARDRHITVHTIAVGDPTAAGEDALDEETLRTVAATTGGLFSRADDRAALAGIYDRIDRLRTRDAETVSHRPRLDMFFWPLGAALLLSLAYHGARALRVALRNPPPRLASATVAAVPLVPLLGDFHFLRPWWLAALVPAFVLGWLAQRRQDPARAWRSVIAPHLLAHLQSGDGEHRRIGPATLLVVAWVLMALSAAGPTWRREPSPFADDLAALMMAIEVTPTMLAQDVQPSRLARAAQKVRDVLASRRGTRAGLVAYAGSAHLVMPLTRDGEVIARFADELSPDVMPADGDAASAALAVADEQLRRAGLPGSILLLTDGIPADEIPKLAAHRRAGAPVQILALAAGPEAPLPAGSPPAPALDRGALDRAADALGARVVTVTPDDGDVRAIARHAESRVVAGAGAVATGERWQDAGYWLVWAVAAIALVWFRPGWVVQWS